MLVTGADSLEVLAVYIGMLGLEFRVDGPPALVEHLRVRRRAVRPCGQARQRPDDARGPAAGRHHDPAVQHVVPGAFDLVEDAAVEAERAGDAGPGDRLEQRDPGRGAAVDRAGVRHEVGQRAGDARVGTPGAPRPA